MKNINLSLRSIKSWSTENFKEQATYLRPQYGHVSLVSGYLFDSFNREEKSLRQVAMVETFLNDNKPKKSLKSLFALFQISQQ